MEITDPPKNLEGGSVDPIPLPSADHAGTVETSHREGAKAHFAAAALHASVSEQHMIAAAAHVQGDHDLACYYAKVVSGDSERAHELSRQALVLSTE